jgi:hypothetical protein
MKMATSTLDSPDCLDAEIFTGDALLTDMEEIKEYIERWTRAIREFDSMGYDNDVPLQFIGEVDA